MKITIIGASSGLGLITTKLALSKKINVTTLSRRVVPVPDSDLLTRVMGTSTSYEDVTRAIADTDAVIITIGKGKNSLESLFADTAEAVLEAVSATDKNIPVLAITGFGAGDSYAYNGFLMKLIISTMLKKEYADKNLMERIFAQSNLNWEIVRPAILTNKPSSKTYKTIPKLFEGIKTKNISREDVADFLLSEVTSLRFPRQYVTLTN